MTALREKKLTEDYKTITKYLLRGMSRNEIADKMNFSTSTVAYKLNKLFSKHNAKNRYEFLINIFSEIINDKRTEIANKDIKLRELKDEINNLRIFLTNIINSNNNKDKFLFWIKKSKTYLKK